MAYPNDNSIDNQCDLSKSFLDKEDIEYAGISMPQKRHNDSGETVITKTMAENLKPFQFKQTAAGNRAAGLSYMQVVNNNVAPDANYLLS